MPLTALSEYLKSLHVFANLSEIVTDDLVILVVTECQSPRLNSYTMCSLLGNYSLSHSLDYNPSLVAGRSTPTDQMIPVHRLVGGKS